MPNSKTEEVVTEGDGLTVRVKPPAKEGKANAAAIRLLARHLNVPRSSVRISGGLASRHKTIEIS